jgi:hypothetical protein
MDIIRETVASLDRQDLENKDWARFFVRSTPEDTGGAMSRLFKSVRPSVAFSINSETGKPTLKLGITASVRW